MSTENDFDMDMIETLGPEFTVFVGLLLIMSFQTLETVPSVSQEHPFDCLGSLVAHDSRLLHHHDFLVSLQY